MGEDLKQRQQHDDDEEDDQELFDSDSLLSNSDVDDRDHDGPLYELPTLLEQLPIKRGLSKYYQGKSQSYASLSVVRTLEDLPKKERPHKRKTMMKACGCRVMSRMAPSAASAAQEEEEGGGGKKPPPLHPLQKKYI